MFLLDDGAPVLSPSDLAVSATCELAVLRRLDVQLGRWEAVVSPPDALDVRTSQLRDAHEQQVLARYRAQHGVFDPATGRGVAVVERPPFVWARDRRVLEDKHAETLALLHGGADVVHQAGLFDGGLSGWADFVVRADPPGGACTVVDAKLARHARTTALLQLAAYGDLLARAGVPVSPHVHLVLGDRTVTSHRLDELAPVYRERRARLERLVAAHLAQPGPAVWGAPGVRACGRCDVCAGEVERTRDVLLVAGLRTTQRARLRDAGVRTVDELATSSGPVAGVGAATLDALRAQARLQVRQSPPAGTDAPPAAQDAHGDATPLGTPLDTHGDVGAAALGADRADDAPAGDRADDALRGDRAPGAPPLVFELFAPEVIGLLPAPDPGDLFFDFEGDPLWVDEASGEWGLEYLFGVVEAPARPGDAPVFRTFWAHDRAAEKQALLDFLDYLTERRRRHPHLHVYHYAAYEKSALLRLAGRHGVGEEVVDDLLRDGVLVDLYATVRASLRTGAPSYSIKKLEPLYRDAARDEAGVTTAGDSIAEYAAACTLRAVGALDEAQRRLDQIATYNRDDCVSTLGLRDWLLARAAGHGVHPRAPLDAEPLDGVDDEAPERDPLVTTLLAYADAPADAQPPLDAAPDRPSGTRTGQPSARNARTADQQAVALLAAALGYHWREDKPFWWAHFDRLSAAPDEWTERRSTFVADEVEVVEGWSIPPRARTARRVLRLVGRLEPGSDLRGGAKAFALYDPPLPSAAKRSEGGLRGWTERVTVRAVGTEATMPAGVHPGLTAPDGAPDAGAPPGPAPLDAPARGTARAADRAPDRDVVLVEDALPSDADEHDALPMALGPCAPPRTASITAAVRALAEAVAAHLPGVPRGPALDLLRRVPPRTRSGAPLPGVRRAPDGTPDYVEAITAALLDLDDSCLAVQGPPGTGKTYTGARVVAALVARGWRVGVVAQSHAVVENLLRAVVAAGVDPDRIGKKPSEATDPAAPWRHLRTDAQFAALLGDPPPAPSAGDGAPAPGPRTGPGAVVGGTAWDLTHTGRVPRGSLDLLVVDEAGQLSLADTVACSVAARRLLLLGDPQQLPQVSQGVHPEPVDRSALGWLTDGHDTLPPHLGYFLAESWRLHPALCAAVSRLSYDGRLTSVPAAAGRSLEGVEPGVHRVVVEHEGNAVASVEEAAAVVVLVRDLVGRRWRDPAVHASGAAVDRPLEAEDVVVVAPFNAQVWTVRRALDAAGLTATRVGTVDRFQGQEAPVAVLTTAASSPEDVPRGIEFLLDRNRVNVAVSRAQWCAFVVRSDRLTDHLPATPEALAQLGAFVGLCEPVVTPAGAHPRSASVAT
ncbi:TM0106 family RecB-like putative nuclease [Cellulomonas sp. NS3]|uniref:TM0106 family RecB-like putative nuclease n=1 Tax=Cellulomonas sp. NS3 TaxID=2973977 RepID=UPI002161D4DF|nr:TM0106 family RecB-like putative nuclease [Cellulomonas sp. NS3]